MDFLRELLRRPVSEPPAELTAYWSATRSARDAFERPVERALVSAARADRLAFAFASGYQAALSALFPALGKHDLAALCATEESGGHPRDIRTRLEDGRITGAKKFVTGAGLAAQLFVVCSIGEDGGRNRLRVARVAAGAAGVKLRPMQDLPFVPELPHAEVDFEGARAEEVFEADGYERYLKPFRTVEDIHVNAALVGYLTGLSLRSGWRVERLAGLAVAAVALAARDPSDAATHVALAGFLDELRAVIDGLDFAAAPPAERERWERDRALLGVAGRVRAKRLERAWEAL